MKKEFEHWDLYSDTKSIVIREVEITRLNGLKMFEPELRENEEWVPSLSGIDMDRIVTKWR